MVSDDERRKVAQRLRELEKCVIGALIPTGELAENILRAIDYGHSGAMTPYGRLADLIEPPARSSKAIRAEASRLDWYDLAPKADIQALWDLADQVDAACAPIDRDALLKLADEMERMPQCELCPAEIVDCSAHPDGCPDALLCYYAQRIREALNQGRR